MHALASRPGRRRLVSIAAAAVLIAGAVLVALSLRGDDPAATPVAITPVAAPDAAAPATTAPESSSTPAPTVTVAATATPTPADTPVSAPPALASWPAGTAATVGCNQLQGSVFENGSVPLDYYGNPPARERVVDQGGYDGTWALEVGIANDYGQYGETVPVTPGQDYVFFGWFMRSGTVADAQLGVTLLDAGYQPLEATVSADLADIQGEFVSVRFSNVPTAAAFAVPFLFKDASPGVLLADELVFGTQTACQPELQRIDS